MLRDREKERDVKRERDEKREKFARKFPTLRTAQSLIRWAVPPVASHSPSPEMATCSQQ